jgi:hypothetical protein
MQRNFCTTGSLVQVSAAAAVRKLASSPHSLAATGQVRCPIGGADVGQSATSQHTNAAAAAAACQLLYKHPEEQDRCHIILTTGELLCRCLSTS